jgi:hypothetical protein
MISEWLFWLAGRQYCVNGYVSWLAMLSLWMAMLAAYLASVLRWLAV